MPRYAEIFRTIYNIDLSEFLTKMVYLPQCEVQIIVGDVFKLIWSYIIVRISLRNAILAQYEMSNMILADS